MRGVDKKAFGRRVAARREALGLSQPALAKKLGMKQQSISNIEKGIVSRPRFMRELAGALETTEVWLLWKEGPEMAASVLSDVEAEEIHKIVSGLTPAQRRLALRLLRGLEETEAA